MTIDRRAFNRYLASGLLVGGCAGFVVGRYTATDDCSTVPLPAREALREAARGAVGVHQIGLSAAELNNVSPLSAERTLFERLALEEGAIIQTSEIFAALDRAIKVDYANHNTVQVNEYILSDTEALFISYALVQQGQEGSVYTAPKPEVKKGVISAGAKSGPTYTVVGQIFNEQLDGHGGIWVLANNTPPGTVIAINGRPIKTRWKAKFLTGAVYDQDLRELIARPAKHEVSIVVPATGIRQVVGELTVRPRPPAALLEDGTPSTVFCEIERWRTQESGGKEVVRVDTFCGPRSTAVYIGDTALTTRIFPNRIEATLDRSVLPAGEHPMRLIDTRSGEAVALGSFKVN